MASNALNYPIPALCTASASRCSCRMRVQLYMSVAVGERRLCTEQTIQLHAAGHRSLMTAAMVGWCGTLLIGCSGLSSLLQAPCCGHGGTRSAAFEHRLLTVITDNWF